jgi:hypothetical protein
MQVKWPGDLSKLDQIPRPKSVERLGKFKNVMWMRWELVRLTWDGREPLVTHMPEDHIKQLENRVKSESSTYSPQVRAQGALG